MSVWRRGDRDWLSSIYALIGPDGRVRYIGRTGASTTDRRMKQHRYARTPVGDFVRAGGVRVRVIERVESQNWPCRRELAWIRAARRAGRDLLNSPSIGKL
jgi:hypothetical protein